MTLLKTSRPAHHQTAPLKALYDVLAPAKLNLFLHITGRRADGYHVLQSVFMLIDWCDSLHLELRKDGVISRTDLGPLTSDVLPADDLTVRAARALQAATGTSLGVNISLEKRIPSQAGMGGGSSDAASCLRALQRPCSAPACMRTGSARWRKNSGTSTMPHATPCSTTGWCFGTNGIPNIPSCSYLQSPQDRARCDRFQANSYTILSRYGPVRRRSQAA